MSDRTMNQFMDWRHDRIDRQTYWPTDQTDRQMAHAIINRLTDSSTDSLTVWLLDTQINRSTDCQIDWPTNTQIDWQTDRITDSSTDSLTDWLPDTDRQTDWLSDRPTDWRTDRPTDRHRLTGRQTDWQTIRNRLISKEQLMFLPSRRSFNRANCQQTQDH